VPGRHPELGEPLGNVLADEGRATLTEQVVGTGPGVGGMTCSSVR